MLAQTVRPAPGLPRCRRGQAARSSGRRGRRACGSGGLAANRAGRAAAAGSRRGGGGRGGARVSLSRVGIIYGETGKGSRGPTPSITPAQFVGARTLTA